MAHSGCGVRRRVRTFFAIESRPGAPLLFLLD